MNTPLSSFSSSLGSRLMAGVGTLTLLAAVGLFSSRPAHTAAGPVPVAVSNLPLPTIPADEAAPRQPFQASASYAFEAGSTVAALINGSDITVPAGKRLVIQTVSLYRFGASQPENVQTYINTTSAGNGAFFALPVVPDNGTNYPGATQPMTLSADPGSTISFTGYRDNAADYVGVVFSVSGYLVNAT